MTDRTAEGAAEGLAAQARRKGAPPAARAAGGRAGSEVVGRAKGRRRLRPLRLLVAALLAGATTGVAWYTSRPVPRILPPPALTPELETELLATIWPGWPTRKPPLPTALGPVTAATGAVQAIAAIDGDADGRAEWGVAYAWHGPVDAIGARVVVPGFAIIRARALGTPPELAYDAPALGGWDGPPAKGQAGAFEGATEATGRVEAVRWSKRELGFLAGHTVETSVGGRMARGQTRAYLPLMGGWVPAWGETTETRLRHDRADEVTSERHVEVADLDGNGTAEIVATPTWYHRHLGPDDRGAHFTAEGPGRLVYRRDGATFSLAAIDGVGPGARPRVRAAAPIYAVRAPKPPTIDADFREWDAVELTELGAVMLDEEAQLRYRRRERRGTHDFSGAVRFMWDEAALYVRADVMDDKLKPAPAGKQLFEGDHLGLWLDVDLGRDFPVARRDEDDWQLGLAPQGLPAAGRSAIAGGEAWTWVPRSGKPDARVASAPLIDPYEGAVRGWRLEAALPWASVGGPPPGLRPGPAPTTADARKELAPRRYQLRLAGVLGCGLVLTDADTEAQELAYVSAPGFGWGAPKTFNTLMLVEGQRLPTP